MQIVSQAPPAAPFTLSAGAATANFVVAAGEPGAGTLCTLPIPGSGKYNGQPFIIRAAGYIAVPAGTYTSAATPLQLVLNGSASAAFAAASGNALFSSTAVAIFTWASATAGSIPWQIEAQFQGNTAGGALMGKANAETSNVNAVGALTASAVTGPFTGTISFTNEPVAQLSVGCITAAANLIAGAVNNLTSFVMEA